MSVEEARQESLRRQRLWMQERQAEQDRASAQEALGAAAEGAGGAERMLGKITEQLTERLRVEMRRETAMQLKEGDVGARVEELLDQHISAHTCPICFELMAGKSHRPVMLFPCGHTFCAACLTRHQTGARGSCPICREPVASQAPNVSLQQVIDGYVERHKSFEKGELLPEAMRGPAGATVARPPAAADDATAYTSQLRLLSMRCCVLRNQLEDSAAEQEALSSRHATSQAVLAHLEAEEAAATRRLEEQRLELELIQSQVVEQRAKTAEHTARQKDLHEMRQLVAKTLVPLEREREKVRLLVQHFSPDVVDALDAEFGF
ncbi:hypothetical protein AB1Y20_013969 [Prymnesium parvum]|uniref:RING-type domain-containing protein n=1 Tax=Prymnesium parvum TaxID=97485 RepID=A0AB34IID5_PRYPA